MIQFWTTLISTVVGIILGVICTQFTDHRRRQEARLALLRTTYARWFAAINDELNSRLAFVELPRSAFTENKHYVDMQTTLAFRAEESLSKRVAAESELLLLETEHRFCARIETLVDVTAPELLPDTDDAQAIVHAECLKVQKAATEFLREVRLTHPRLGVRAR